jgi:hypothetical protein
MEITMLKEKGFSGSTLKLIAMLSMVIDHTAAVLLIGSPYYETMRSIGRLAFPIFCFLLVEGYIHTHNVKRYAFRLLLFAAVSEVPFDLAFFYSPVYWGYQNIFFTLLIGVLVMYGMDWIESLTKVPVFQMLLKLLPLFAGMAVAGYLKTDYSNMGVLSIGILYLFRDYGRFPQSVAGAISFAWEPPAMLAFIPIYFYNGKRGISIKYLFYIFYPAHLLLLVRLRSLGVGVSIMPG